MTDQPSSPSLRAQRRAAAKTRRAKSIERREACFDLFLSGFSLQQIAQATGKSLATVRRILDRSIAERRLDAPERYVRVQVARLTKALGHADFKLEQGDIRAFAPYMKLIAALDRYHGLEARGVLLRPAQIENGRSAPPASLALTHAAAPLHPAQAAEVAEFGA